jgi:uncharacterized protein YoxC
MDTAIDVALLIFLVLVALFFAACCYAVLRLTGGLREILRSTEEAIDGVTKETVPLISEVTTTVEHVNAELVRVDAITENVQKVSTNVASLVSVVGATVGGPAVKAAAFSYGVRRALATRKKDDLEKRIRETMKDEKRSRRAERKARKAT